MSSSKKLIINADDYGLCREVNRAVEMLALDSAADGVPRLGGVSVLASGECWEQAADFLGSHPWLSAGAHLNAVEGRPVSTAPEIGILLGNDGCFAGLKTLLPRWLMSPLAVPRAVEIEWRAQVERLLRAGVKLFHADSHQHLHAFPPAYRIAVRLCREYHIPALRRPVERHQYPERRASLIALRASWTLARAGAGTATLRHNDHFLGFTRAGAYERGALAEDIRRLSEGLTEIALHPSIINGAPYPHYFGRNELSALLNEWLPAEIARLGIELTTWEQATQ